MCLVIILFIISQVRSSNHDITKKNILFDASDDQIIEEDNLNDDNFVILLTSYDDDAEVVGLIKYQYDIFFNMVCPRHKESPEYSSFIFIRNIELYTETIIDRNVMLISKSIKVKCLSGDLQSKIFMVHQYLSYDDEEYNLRYYEKNLLKNLIFNDSCLFHENNKMEEIGIVISPYDTHVCQRFYSISTNHTFNSKNDLISFSTNLQGITNWVSEDKITTKTWGLNRNSYTEIFNSIQGEDTIFVISTPSLLNSFLDKEDFVRLSFVNVYLNFYTCPNFFRNDYEIQFLSCIENEVNKSSYYIEKHILSYFKHTSLNVVYLKCSVNYKFKLECELNGKVKNAIFLIDSINNKKVNIFGSACEVQFFKIGVLKTKGNEIGLDALYVILYESCEMDIKIYRR